MRPNRVFAAKEVVFPCSAEAVGCKLLEDERYWRDQALTCALSSHAFHSVPFIPCANNEFASAFVGSACGLVSIFDCC